MTANEVLSALQESGASINILNHRVTVALSRETPAPLKAELATATKAATPDILNEVQQRAAVMRLQVPPSPLPIPLLCYRQVPPQDGHCVSCGERLHRPFITRCPLCALAAADALSAYPVKEAIA